MLLRQQQNTLQLYRPQDIPKVLERLITNWQTRSEALQLSHSELALVNLAHRLEGKNPVRTLRRIPSMWRWETLERHLQVQFPHFAEVTERVKQAVFLSLHSGCQLQLPSMLLLGDPGLGKTFYVRTLARSLMLDFRFIPMSTATAGFILSGMDSRWSEAKPGLLFMQLVEGEIANPLFLLDEIDKAGAEGRYDALGPLYGLLEGHTAQNFEDEYFPLAVDASQVQWMATANDLVGIPGPIQSRMEVFEIPKPTREQRRSLVPVLYARLLDERPWGKLFDTRLNQELAAELADRHETPREIRKALESLCGRMASSTRALPVSDTEDEMLELYPSLGCLPVRKAPQPGFGFIQTRSESRGTNSAGKRMIR